MHHGPCIPVTDGMKRHSASKQAAGKKLLAIYRTLYHAFGPRHWWPGDTSFEMMVGAVLTRNTAWSNGEKAIANLKRERLLALSRLNAVSFRRPARPRGYFNVKATRLKRLPGSYGQHSAEALKECSRTIPGN